MWLNFTPKITNLYSGASGGVALWPRPGRCPGPTWGLKAAPNPHAFEKKIHSPLARIPGSVPETCSLNTNAPDNSQSQRWPRLQGQIS